MSNEVRDINGTEVHVGSFVRVLKISDETLAQLTEAEAEAARLMEGEVLEVNEIDDWGGAWVEMTWGGDDGVPVTHSLGLGPEQMEVVEEPSED